MVFSYKDTLLEGNKLNRLLLKEKSGIGREKNYIHKGHRLQK
jgi:hypothetical protein